MAWKKTDRKFETQELREVPDPPDRGLWLLPLLLWLILVLGGATLSDLRPPRQNETDRPQTNAGRSVDVASDGGETTPSQRLANSTI